MMSEHWSVTVERDGDAVVTIASNSLSGRELLPGDEDVIRRAAQHLLSFVGGLCPRIEDTSQTLPRVDGDEVAQALGVDPTVLAGHDPTQAMVIWHWTGRAVCPFCQEAAHRSEAKIREHMKTCARRPEGAEPV